MDKIYIEGDHILKTLEHFHDKYVIELEKTNEFTPLELRIAFLFEMLTYSLQRTVGIFPREPNLYKKIVLEKKIERECEVRND